MKKRFWKVSNVLMSSAIAMLGFSGCRTTQQTDPVKVAYGPPPGYELELQRRAQEQAKAEAERQAQLEQQRERERMDKVKLVYGPPPSPYRNATPDPDGIYDIVEDMPSFDGDIAQWLAEHLRYPAQARRQQVEGRVIVSFIVRDDGTIDGVTVVRSVNRLLDAEAVRLVKSMPQWRPGGHNGRPVNVRYVLPVDFRL